MNDGGPAFACAAENGHQSGMTMWAYFATHSPFDAAYLHSVKCPTSMFPKFLAECAADYADAIIKERDKRMKGEK